MASSQIPLPEKLDFKKPEERKRWIERFECYRVAAGLNEKDDKVQVNMLVYAMGGNANDIRRDYSHIFVNFGEICKNFNFNLKTLLKL